MTAAYTIRSAKLTASGMVDVTIVTSDLLVKHVVMDRSQSVDPKLDAMIQWALADKPRAHTILP